MLNNPGDLTVDIKAEEVKESESTEANNIVPTKVNGQALTERAAEKRAKEVSLEGTKTRIEEVQNSIKNLDPKTEAERQQREKLVQELNSLTKRKNKLESAKQNTEKTSTKDNQEIAKTTPPDNKDSHQVFYNTNPLPIQSINNTPEDQEQRGLSKRVTSSLNNGNGIPMVREAVQYKPIRDSFRVSGRKTEVATDGSRHITELEPQVNEQIHDYSINFPKGGIAGDNTGISLQNPEENPNVNNNRYLTTSNTTIKAIEKLPILVKESKLTLEELKQKAHNLNLEGEAVGQALVIDRATSKQVETIITKETWGISEKYRIYAGSNELGSITAYKLSYQIVDLGDWKLISHGKYGVRDADAPYKDSFYVLDIRSPENDKFQGVGTTLHQLVVERSRELGLEGRVTLDAAKSSHVFHAKTDFQVEEPTKREKIDKKLAEEIQASANEKRQLNTRDLGSVIMYLPEESIAEWEKRISLSPILSRTSSLDAKEKVDTLANSETIETFNNSIQQTAPGTKSLSEFRSSIESLIINDKRPEIHAELKNLLQEIVEQNTGNEFLQGVLEKGELNISILDATQENAFVEKANNNIYITTALLQKIKEVFPNNYYDAVTFIVCHELGHKLAAERKGELEDNIANSDNTWEEDFADKTALELMHKAGFDIESIDGIFGKLFGDGSKLKSIPGVDSHPHGNDSDLFIKQKINDVFSRQEGEYVSNLSNVSPRREIINELALPNKYDFAKLEESDDGGWTQYDEILIYEGSEEGETEDKYDKLIASFNEDNVDNIEKWLVLSGLSEIRDVKKNLLENTLAKLPISSDTKLFFKELLLSDSEAETTDSNHSNSRSLLTLRNIIKELPNFNESDLNLNCLLIPWNLNKLYLAILKELASNEYTVSEVNNISEFLTFFDNRIPSNYKQFSNEAQYLVNFPNNQSFVIKVENLISENNDIKTIEFLNRLSESSIIFLIQNSQLVKDFYLKTNTKQNHIVSKIHEFLTIEELTNFVIDSPNRSVFFTVFASLGDKFEQKPREFEIDYRNRTTVDDYTIFSNSLDKLVNVIDKFYPPTSDLENNLLQKQVLVGYFMNSLTYKPNPINVEDLRKAIDISPASTDFHVEGTANLYTNVFKPFLVGEKDQNKTNASFQTDLSNFYHSLRELISKNNLEQVKMLLRERFDKDFLVNPDILPPLKEYPIEVQVLPSNNTLNYRLSLKRQIETKTDPQNNRPYYEYFFVDYQGNKWTEDDYYEDLASEKRINRFNPINEFSNFFNNLFEAYPSLLNPQVFKSYLLIQKGEYQALLLKTYIEKTGRELNTESIKEFSPFLERTPSIKFGNNHESNDYVNLLEAPGLVLPNGKQYFEPMHGISALEYLYLEYFNNNLEAFKEKTATKIINWLEENWNEKGSYRDVILNKIFTKDNRFDSLEREVQLKIINLYDSEFKSVKLREKYIDSNLPKAQTLEQKIRVITDVLTEASKERDSRIEKAFLETGFTFNNVEKYKSLFCENSLEAFKKDRIATHGAGAALSYILNSGYGTLSDTRETINWLINKKNELPETLSLVFKNNALNPDQLRELFKEIKPLREGVTLIRKRGQIERRTSQ